MVKKSANANSNSMILKQWGPSIKELTVRLNIQPTQEILFIEALTHSSYANEHRIPSNERLEFLGDSVVSLIVCQYLYCHYRLYDEGQLSKLKAIIVSAPLLAGFSKQLGLDKYILLGAGEIRANGGSKQNISADLFEAFIGAYYLNFGLEATTKFIIPFVERVLPEIFSQSEQIDAKTCLQELAQSQGLKPEYRMVTEEGPPHDRTFTVEVRLLDQVLGCGVGKSLKEAQNKAAITAIHQFKQ
ncbi:MAG TPA: ribonuclease III [Firmicutes bacterium]|jgi:ribonuclease III|nr:ribonuclease III [Bacillota bacterium]